MMRTFLTMIPAGAALYVVYLVWTALSEFVVSL